MADHGGGKIDHSPSNAAVGKKIAGKNEEGYGHDLELFNAGEQLQGHGFQRHLSHGKEKGEDG